MSRYDSRTSGTESGFTYPQTKRPAKEEHAAGVVKEGAAEFTTTRYGRNWAVYDPSGELVCLTVYKCGALEVIRRLSAV